MKKSRLAFFYALSLYSSVSLAHTTAQYYSSVTLLYVLYWLAAHVPGLNGFLLGGPSVFDSVRFAYLTATNTLLQYYLSSLLVHDLKIRLSVFGILFFSAIAAIILFERLSARSDYGHYVYACVPMTASYLLGGLTSLFQKETDNPFHTSRVNIFRID